MKSNLISKSETTALLRTVSERWEIKLPKVKNVKVYQILNDAQIITGDGIKILKVGEDYLPFLSETETLQQFPSVTVDMGAVRFMCKGANVMRPGIKEFTEFYKDKLVCIIEESQHKFLAVGKAMIDSSELLSIKKGQVIKNVHYISDRFWETGKTIYD